MISTPHLDELNRIARTGNVQAAKEYHMKHADILLKEAQLIIGQKRESVVNNDKQEA